MDKKALPPVEEWDPQPFYNEKDQYTCKPGGNHRLWYIHLLNKFKLHAAVEKMLVYKPLDPAQLAREWPHASETDPTRLAYTRNENDGLDDRQLVTSIGKYLARHWPHVPDHIRRDVQNLFTPDEMFISTKIEDIISAAELGPRSCMSSRAGYLHTFVESELKLLQQWVTDPTVQVPWHQHPYYVYDPAFGWAMAIRKNGNGTIDGRALVLHAAETKLFVRSYRRNIKNPNDDYSDRDFTLDAWLQSKGYELRPAWPIGARLRFVPHGFGKDGSTILGPYMDGGLRTGYAETVEGNNMVIKLGANTDTNYYEFSGTSGRCELIVPSDDDDDDDDDEYHFYCDCCEDRTHVDDARHLDFSDSRLCEGCTDSRAVTTRSDHLVWDDEAIWVEYGIGGESYYIHASESFFGQHVELRQNCEWAHKSRVYNTAASGECPFYELIEDCVELQHLTDDGHRYANIDNAYTPGDGTYWFDREHYLEHHPDEEEEAQAEVTPANQPEPVHV